MKNKKLYVLPYQGIGDIMITLGCLKEYVEKNDFQKVILFYTKGYRELYSFYDFDFARTVCIPRFCYRALKRFFSTKVGYFVLKTKKNILCTDTVFYVGHGWKNTFSISGLSVFKFIKEGIMGIKPESKIIFPQIPKLQVNFNSDIMNKKIAVLNPFSKTILIPSWQDAYTKIAHQLSELGYHIFTDCGKDYLRKAINGTEPFYGDLTESFELCKKASLVIGTRSGYLDLMLFSGTKIIALYDNDCENIVAMNAFNIKETAKIFGLSGDNCFQFQINEIEKLQALLAG